MANIRGALLSKRAPGMTFTGGGGAAARIRAVTLRVWCGRTGHLSGTTGLGCPVITAIRLGNSRVPQQDARSPAYHGMTVAPGAHPLLSRLPCLAVGQGEDDRQTKIGRRDLCLGSPRVEEARGRQLRRPRRCSHWSEPEQPWLLPGGGILNGGQRNQPGCVNTSAVMSRASSIPGTRCQT